MTNGYIHSIESFGSVDGPGVRYIIFLSGCPYRCLYCHNPDTWKPGQGQERSPQDLLNEALSCREYWGSKGGITVSGGEPLLQTDFLIDLFTLAKEQGINTCIDTAGGPFTSTGPWFEKFQKLMSLTDTVLLDIKHIDSAEHKKLTGHSNENVIELFRYLDSIQKPVWIRHVLVPGITDDDKWLTLTRDFIRTLSNIHRVEILPYHTLGISKYQNLGIPYPLDKTPGPSAERIANAKKILECETYTRWRD